MKIIEFNFKMPLNPLVLELQIYCKKLILSTDDTCIVNLYDVRKRMQAKAELISVNYPYSECEYIRYEIRTSMTVEMFHLIHNDEIFISLTSRKREFEFAFKDIDNSRYN